MKSDRPVTDREDLRTILQSEPIVIINSGIVSSGYYHLTLFSRQPDSRYAAVGAGQAISPVVIRLWLCDHPADTDRLD